MLNRLKTVDKTEGICRVVYDQSMMNEDLGYYHTEPHQSTTLYLKEDNNATYVYENQIVVNMMNAECVLISHKHSGVLLPYNYTQIEIDRNKIYPAYFVYWFNESPESLKQLNLFRQGGSLVKKITAKQLQQMKITLPPYNKQKVIGDIAEKRRRLKYLKQKREKLMDCYLKETLLRGNH
ncbi:restriction endonuclease subunit S [Staphylococcus simulans]|uniref:restriction endonuclease subunit S n=1 Tax=Staphylococcus simulans TaxID=1286 RepID=UPI0021750125|nr:restriction endonuclease subunit S [Staphylococcus simulans]